MGHARSRDSRASGDRTISKTKSGSAPSSPALSLHPDPGGRTPITAIRASAALKGLGRMIRKEKDAGLRAETVDEIDDFWSYSRHGPRHERIATLMLYYNGLRSAVVGLASSIAGGWLLPVHWCQSGNGHGVLVMFLASCAALASMVFWQSSRRVFLDFACIPQDDEEAKQRGIRNLGVTLSCSRNFLCLWDSTYWTRLWCVFEVAAYLKLAADGQGSRRAVVLSLTDGQMARATFVCILLVASGVHLPKMASQRGCLDGFTLRALIISQASSALSVAVSVALVGVPSIRWMGRARNQRTLFRDFSLEGTSCYCCSVGHDHPETGEAMSCDRDSMASVAQWFGDAETFESYVRGEMHQHLHAPSYLSYKHALFGAMPWFWLGVGGCAWHLRVGEELEAMCFVLTAARHAFSTVPVQTRLVFLAFAHCQPKSDARWEWARQVGKCAAVCGLSNFALLFVGNAASLLQDAPATTPLGLAKIELAGSVLPMAAVTLAVYWRDLRHCLRGGPAGPGHES